MENVQAIENLSKEEFDKQRWEAKSARYKKTVFYGCVGLALFAFLAFAFLFVAFFFLGVTRVFNAEFSFIGIIQWLDGLPSVVIEDAKFLKAKFILGAIAFPFYLLIAVVLIVKGVFIIKNVVRLSNVSINGLSPTKLTSLIVGDCIRTFCHVFFFIACTAPTVSKPLPVVTLCLFVVFALLMVAEILLKSLYLFYKPKKGVFQKKQFTLSLIRGYLLLLFSALSFVFAYNGYLALFLPHFLKYLKNGRFVFSAELIRLLSFLLHYLILLLCAKIIVNTVKNSGLRLINSTYNFYGKSMSTQEFALQYYRKKLKKQTNSLIFFSILAYLLEFLSRIWVDGRIAFPANGLSMLLSLSIGYVSLLFMAVALKCICKIPVKYTLN